MTDTSSSQHVTRIGALVALVCMGTMWGLQFNMLKLAAQGGHSDLTVLMIALVLLTILFTGIASIKREQFEFHRGLIPFFLITSVLGYVIPLMATLYAAPQLPAGILVLIASLAPVAAIATASLWRSERITGTMVTAVVLALISVVLILWPELDLPDHGKAHWILIALLAPLTYGIESVYIAKNWPKNLSALQAVTGETLVAAVLVAPIYTVYGDPVPTDVSWTAAETGIVVFVTAGVIESLLYFYLIRRTGGVFVNFATFIALLAGIAWGILIFAETHPANVWISVALLIVALILAGRATPQVYPSSNTS